MPEENVIQHKHLPLPKTEIARERRPRISHRPTILKPFREHGPKIDADIKSVLKHFKASNKIQPKGIDPKLLLRVKLETPEALKDTDWKKNNLTVVSEDRDGVTILLADDVKLKELQRRLKEYKNGPRPDKKSAPHTPLFNFIENVREVSPADRTGELLKNIKIVATQQYVLDLELWHPGNSEAVKRSLDQITSLIKEQGGKVTDHYITKSVCLARIIVQGSLIKQLLNLEAVAKLDLPPKPFFNLAEILSLTINDFTQGPKPTENAPKICVIDSGIVAGHPLLSSAVGEAISIPNSIGSPVDDIGHGTMVAGIALYNDVLDCISNRQFTPSISIFSAKVTEAVSTINGNEMKFPDEKLIHNQMHEAIKYFKDNYNCRVFNISLGDSRKVYDGNKPSIWAWTLDAIARELDVVIIVPTGNFDPVPDNGNQIEALTAYPQYLFNPSNRIIEPATAAIALTVGALSHSISPSGTNGQSNIQLAPIAPVNAPSPFTRIGPGVGDSIKPELCEYGGNQIFDHGLNIVSANNPGINIISLNHNFSSGRLFNWDIGTSFAAPKIAHYAAQILNVFPDASANLVRALLANSASVPNEATNALNNLADDACLKACGYGKPNLNDAIYSSDTKVTLYAESELLADQFHIYELPLPKNFRETKGKRNISVTLAFDPPTRHTRKDYLGFEMNFCLIRGKSLDQVTNIFRTITKEERKAKKEGGIIEALTKGNSECLLNPSHRLREGGTLQKGVFCMVQNPKEEYGEIYYLVVQCIKNWSDEEKQRYAIVVTLEHVALVGNLPGQISLYQAIQERIRTKEQIRLT